MLLWVTICHNQGKSVNERKVLVKALVLALALAVWSGAATAITSIPTKPDTLLAVEQNRSTIIDGIVAAWGSQLELSGAGLNRDQLRTMLESLRADQLLAASVAGSLSGLRNVLANAADIQYAAPGRISAKALGNAAQDVVYTPIVPCRIVDTRLGGGGVFQAQAQRDWVAYSPGGFASQGGSATDWARNSSRRTSRPFRYALAVAARPTSAPMLPGRRKW